MSKDSSRIIGECVLAKVLNGSLLIENPARIINPSTFNVSLFGAFSFCSTGRFDHVSSVGRFCSIAADVNIGPVEHNMQALSTSTFLNDDAAWALNSDYADYWSQKCNSRDELYKLLRSPKSRNQSYVTIGNDVWIGANAIIRRGVSIGDGAVIGANSVVSRDVGPYEVVMGVPAIHIRYRFSEGVRNRLCESKWWTWDLKSLHGIEWSDPGKASVELHHRYCLSSYSKAEYDYYC